MENNREDSFDSHISLLISSIEYHNEIKEVKISKEKNIIFIREGWGTTDSGWWLKGDYRWEVFIDNESIGSTVFYIVNAGQVTTEENPYFEIEEIEVGDVTKPLEYYDRGGETLYRIVMLNSRTKPHRASLEQDYSRISTFAKESKKNQYYNSWMIDRMEDTFIKVDKDLATCDNLMRWVDEDVVKE